MTTLLVNQKTSNRAKIFLLIFFYFFTDEGSNPLPVESPIDMGHGKGVSAISAYVYSLAVPLVKCFD